VYINIKIKKVRIMLEKGFRFSSRFLLFHILYASSLRQINALMTSHVSLTLSVIFSYYQLSLVDEGQTEFVYLRYQVGHFQASSDIHTTLADVQHLGICVVGNFIDLFGNRFHIKDLRKICYSKA